MKRFSNKLSFIALAAMMLMGTKTVYAQTPLFFEGFENVKQSDLKSGSEAPTDVPTAAQQGKFYNYGGRGKIMSDPAFGNYYQNLADADEYTKSIAENFLRITLTDDMRTKIGDAVSRSKAMTVGFWVNGQVAVDYELPLECGSMFCIFSNERFRKADNYDEKPRFMFDIACNGWTYSYMPNSDANGNTIGVNQFFYEESNKKNRTEDKVLVSLFGKDNYIHPLNQSKYKFYDDKKWHYVAYVMDQDLTRVTVYLDGVQTGRINNVKNLAGSVFTGNTDYPGRTRYLRNIVLGGFTPHGLFYDKQYYSDAALAYDDIAIYGQALSQDQIKAIINEKDKSKTWMFGDDGTGTKGEGFNNNTTTGLKFETYITEPYDDGYWTGKGKNRKWVSVWKTREVWKENNKGLNSEQLLAMDGKEKISVLNVPNGYYVRFESKYSNSNSVNPPAVESGTWVGTRESAENEGYTITTIKSNGEVRLKINSDIIFKSIKITPYQYADVKWGNKVGNNEYNILPDATKYVTFDAVGKNTFKQNGTVISNPSSVLPKVALKIDGDGFKDVVNGYTESRKTNGAYIKYTSSAPHVATVDADGNITMTGIAGNAYIKAEIISNNLFNESEVTDYFEVRVRKDENTLRLKSGVAVDVADRFPEVYNEKYLDSENGYDDKKLENITLTVGGWPHTEGNVYASATGQVKDGWEAGKSFGSVKECLDEFNIYSKGKEVAKSESYGLNNDFKVNDGDFAASSNEVNKTPWTLPSRGSYVKFEPLKAGIVTMYIHQDGNLEKSASNLKRSNHVYWRPVYIADETGKVVEDVQTATSGLIGPEDQFFSDDKRRAQFLEDELTLYNFDESLRKDLIYLRDKHHDRFVTLINNWANAEWTQKVFESEDGGHLVMSTAIVRYTFNVYPGKTYYLFSNAGKIGIAGFNFEEDRLMRKDSNGNIIVRDVEAASEVINYTDNVDDSDPVIPTDKKDYNTVTYTRNFYQNKWGSICLPFSMNNRQMREQFGDETAVVIMKGIDENGTIQMVWHTNQDIIAGYPYFILPRGEIKNENVSNGVISKIEANVVFEDKIIKENNPLFSVGSKFNTIDWSTSYNGESYSSDYPYVFVGNLTKETAPAGSYVMLTNGVLTKAKNTPTIKPFRAYLKYQGSDPTKAKPLNFGNWDQKDETTAINDFMFQNGILTESSDVYSIDGTKIRHNVQNLSGLDKGIYIINGKKYVVE